MPYGCFGSAKEAVRLFVDNHIMAAFLSINPPKILNVFDSFNSFLRNNDFGEVRASIETEKQEVLILRYLEEQLEEWRALGVPTPVDYVEENKSVLVSWKHKNFRQRYYGEKAYNTENFVSVYNWLFSLQDRNFLFACSLYLKLLRCNPIYITDGKGDGGIDCIGKVSDGPFRSLIVFVQAKSKKGKKANFSLNTLRQEYAKYVALKRSENYLLYRNKLLSNESGDGSGEVYFFSLTQSLI